MWRTGARRVSASAVIFEDLRNDMLRQWEMLKTRTVKRLHFDGAGGFAWHPRLPDIRERALSAGESAVATVYTDASSLHGRGAAYGNHFIQGRWSELERREGINWKEL